MEIKGKIIQILPLQSGVSSASKEWKKQDVVIETEGQYPKKVCLSAMNNKIGSFAIGDTVNFQIEPESREYNGKWYTSLNIWKYEKQGASQTEQKAEPIPLNEPGATGNDLPF